MIFGGLSEKEVVQISSLLEKENIHFEVVSDETIMNSNELSMRNNLRHLTGPNISTHVLAINISDDAFAKMGDELRAKLLTYGITDEAPEEFSAQGSSENPHEMIHRQMLDGNKRVIGWNLMHLVILVFAAFLLAYVLNSFI